MQKKSDRSVSEEPTSVEATASLNNYILLSTGRGIRPEIHKNALSERRQRNDRIRVHHAANTSRQCLG